MGDKSKIEWTDATWNPVRGCSRVSEGCRNCYAERVAARFAGPGMPYEGLADLARSGSKWTGTVRLVESALDQPLRWQKPRRIFVNSMSDLFHENLSDAAIGQVFAVMARAHRHTFQVLTKRPERMRSFMQRGHHLPNVWLGVSTEDQKTADERIPILLDTPAAVRFISAEPLLGPLDLTDYLVETASTNRDWYLDWVIAGGESGPGARPCHTDWIRGLRDECAETKVPFFFKQWGEHQPRPTGEANGHWVWEKVGKKAAGAMLDGREHREFPRCS